VAAVELVKDQSKSGRKLLRIRNEPRSRMFDCPELTGFQFIQIDSRNLIGDHAVGPYEFPARLLASFHLEAAEELSGGHFQPEFLLRLTSGTDVVLLPAVQVTRSAGIKTPGKSVLGSGAFLNKKLGPRIEKQDMDGPMPQLAPMHLGARGRTDHTILFVNHIEDLVR